MGKASNDRETSVPHCDVLSTKSRNILCYPASPAFKGTEFLQCLQSQTATARIWASLGCLGVVLGHLEPSRAKFAVILGPLGAILGLSWGIGAILGPSWDHLGAILVPSWDRLAPSWAPPGAMAILRPRGGPGGARIRGAPETTKANAVLVFFVVSAPPSFVPRRTSKDIRETVEVI